MQRNAHGGAMFPVVEATIRPSAFECAGGVRQHPFPIRLAVHKHPLISGIAKDKDAAPIREAVCELAII